MGSAIKTLVGLVVYVALLGIGASSVEAVAATGRCEQQYQKCKSGPGQLTNWECEQSWYTCVSKKCVASKSANDVEQCPNDPDCERSCTEDVTSTGGLLGCCVGGPEHNNSCRTRIDRRCGGKGGPPGVFSSAYSDLHLLEPQRGAIAYSPLVSPSRFSNSPATISVLPYTISGSPAADNAVLNALAFNSNYLSSLDAQPSASQPPETFHGPMINNDALTESAKYQVARINNPSQGVLLPPPPNQTYFNFHASETFGPSPIISTPTASPCRFSIFGFCLLQ